MLKKILIIVGIILIIFLLFANYMGMFKKISVKPIALAETYVVYMSYTGPYSKQNEVYKKLEAFAGKENSSEGIGVYFDDPKTTPKEKTRALVGLIVTEEVYNKFMLSAVKAPDDIKFAKLPEFAGFYAQFPYKNPMSFMVGPMKVYPAFYKYYIKEKIKFLDKMVTIEVYDAKLKYIKYYIPYTVEADVYLKLYEAK